MDGKKRRGGEQAVAADIDDRLAATIQAQPGRGPVGLANALRRGGMAAIERVLVHYCPLRPMAARVPADLSVAGVT